MSSDPDTSSAHEVTQLLSRWTDGDETVLEALIPIVYSELKKIAVAYFRRERNGHTLQATAVVNEAWIRLSRQAGARFTHRKQFYGLAAQIMRRVLVDHARAAGADKRRGTLVATNLDQVEHQQLSVVDVIALDQALEQLAQQSARQARVIELRYFGGLNLEEMADVLGVSIATVSRDQKVAEAWLGHLLNQ